MTRVKIKLSAQELALINRIQEFLLRYKNYMRYDQYSQNLKRLSAALGDKNIGEVRVAILGFGKSDVHIPSAIDCSDEEHLCRKHAHEISKLLDRFNQAGTAALSLPWDTLAEVVDEINATI